MPKNRATICCSDQKHMSISTIAVEPIEKKPFRHFLSGTKTLSYGQFGCNLNCKFCENIEISQNISIDASEITPINIVELCKKYGGKSICASYNEPLYNFEDTYRMSIISSKYGIPFIMKTNGYTDSGLWSDILKKVKAINIDFKGSRISFKRITGADSFFWYDRIEEAIDKKVHIEISVPLYYETLEEMRENIYDLANFLNNRHRRKIPIHLLKVNYTERHPHTTSKDMIQNAMTVFSLVGIKNIHIFDF